MPNSSKSGSSVLRWRGASPAGCAQAKPLAREPAAAPANSIVPAHTWDVEIGKLEMTRGRSTRRRVCCRVRQPGRALAVTARLLLLGNCQCPGFWQPHPGLRLPSCVVDSRSTKRVQWSRRQRGLAYPTSTWAQVRILLFVSAAVACCSASQQRELALTTIRHQG